ncbi:catabolite control protein A [Ligilactobacillus ceti]|uniref:Catabolite control protein A n=1 Tax=Ligilactobacillus ceti DSM 22408 TaxID=1122146 RepID=A0A0R2KKS9_9LACO|nr:catabolite control protein A [Ligilactobacillus ceti]KRN89971.1 catabolite control protein a [Ligilactobacillus ceti DSM 22408]
MVEYINGKKIDENKPITIREVSEAAQVSMATVSRVINGNPNVKPATRKKVLKVIEELDYRPNAVARGLASKKTTTVGVIIPDITNVYFSSLALGIDDIATMYKYNIILANSESDEQKEIQVLNTLLAKQVDGIIFMGNTITEEMRRQIKRAKIPFVIAGSVDSLEEIESVHIDYVAASEEAVRDLVNHGNERIAFVSGSLTEPINGEYRLQGYKNVLAENNIEFDPELVFETGYNYHSGEIMWPALSAMGVTAVYAGDDELAAGILNSAQDAGIKVPEDFEIVTSNNSKLTKIVRPKMSSITEPLYDIGAVAMRYLTKMMNKEEVETENKTIILPYGYIKRSTTK